MTRNYLLTGALSLALICAGTATALAQHRDHQHHDQEKSAEAMQMPHGGGMAMADGHHFEVVFNADGVRLYAFKGEMEPVAMKNAKATMTLSPQKGDPVKLDLAYVAPDIDAGRTQGYLGAEYAFADADIEGMKAAVSVSGLTDKAIAFEAPVAVVPVMMYACPMNCVAPVMDPMACPKCGMQMKPKMTEMDGEHKRHEEHDGSHDHDH